MIGEKNSPVTARTTLTARKPVTAAMTEAYGTPLEAGANCVVVSGRRDGTERIAACVVRADTRADVNNLVKRTLDVRKASFLSMDRAVGDSGMEYGGITPVGLPAGWRVLVDRACLDIEVAIIGSGVRRSKLLLPGHRLGDLPHAEVVDELADAEGADDPWRAANLALMRHEHARATALPGDLVKVKRQIAARQDLRAGE